MQICNSSLKKATDLKRKSFFFIQQTVLFNWAPSQNSPLFHRIIFFGCFFRLLISKACLKMTKISPTLN